MQQVALRPRGVNFLTWGISDPLVNTKVYFPLTTQVFSTTDTGKHARAVTIVNQHTSSINVRVYTPAAPDGNYVVVQPNTGQMVRINGTITAVELRTANSGGPVHVFTEHD